MENIINLDLEQPIDNEFTLNDKEYQKTNNQENQKQDLLKGSTIGKFKTEQDLLNAYESLEKEFTKKCQQLKQLENNKSDCDNALAPQYTKSDWQEKVNIFFEQNPKAKGFVEQISEVLSCDKDLACSQNSLEQAYGKVLANNFKSADDFMNDNDFIENYVLKNENIKQKIINEYLAEVSKDRFAPLMMNKGGNCVVLPNSKPRNMQEANMLAKYCLK